MNDAVAVLERLIDAANRHDLDGIVSSFADDVTSETPAHPSRSFVGSAQVRRNWSQILEAVPDFAATIVSAAVSSSRLAGATAVWAELAFEGTRPDGAPFRLRGVTINDVVGTRIAALRFYLEPVEHEGATPDLAVARALGRAPSLALQGTVR